jgi:hypothetical protein
MNIWKSPYMHSRVMGWVARRDQMGRTGGKSATLRRYTLTQPNLRGKLLAATVVPYAPLVHHHLYQPADPFHPTDNTSTKMAPVKKSKSAKSSESINSRLQLVVKSGKVSDRPHLVSRDMATKRKKLTTSSPSGTSRP